MTTTTATTARTARAYENKNTHEARNEAIVNGNGRFADLIWAMWDKLEEDDPTVSYDEFDFGTNLGWLREMGENELADEIAAEAGNAYGTEEVEAKYRIWEYNDYDC